MAEVYSSQIIFLMILKVKPPPNLPLLTKSMTHFNFMVHVTTKAVFLVMSLMAFNLVLQL